MASCITVDLWKVDTTTPEEKHQMKKATCLGFCTMILKSNLVKKKIFKNVRPTCSFTRLCDDGAKNHESLIIFKFKL